MTPREVVIAALSHRETPVVPFQVGYTAQEYQKMLAYTGNQDFAAIGSRYLHGFSYDGYPTACPDRAEHFVDDYGVIWNRSGADKDIGVVDTPTIPEPDLSLFREPCVDEDRIRRDCEHVIRTRGDRFTHAGIGFSLFERLWSYVGMENALVYMLTDKEFMHGLLDRICAYNLKIIDIMNEYPFDGMYFGDDWGQQRGMIMGAPLWREFIKPRLQKMYAHASRNGKFIIQHSCGDIHEVFEDLIEIGLDCYQTFQPEIYDMAAVKEQVGDRLSFWGGISTQAALPNKSPDEIRKIVRDTLRIMKKGGGFIVGPTHAIPQDVPPENVLAMLDEFLHQNCEV